MINRIVDLRKLIGLSQSDFAKKIEISQAGLSQIESGKTSIAISTLYKIIEEFQLNAEWLLFGDGPVFKNQVISIAKGTPLENEDYSQLSLIPFVNREAEAGYLDQCNDVEYVKSLTGYRIPGFEHGEFRMFQISGDSMNPSLFEDEVVIAELVEDIECIQANRQCIIVTKEGIVAKRIFPQPDDKFLLKSDNPKYKSYKLRYDIIIEMWEIRAKITTEFLSPPLQAQISDEIDKRIEALENTVNMLSRALQSDGKV
jgi:transcriptional regulator with XRE-family HTH domain